MSAGPSRKLRRRGFTPALPAGARSRLWRRRKEPPARHGSTGAASANHRRRASAIPRLRAWAIPRSFSPLQRFCAALRLRWHYAILTILLPRGVAFNGLDATEEMRAWAAAPWGGAVIVDLRNGDIVEWLRLEGGANELFDVGIIENIRCPRGLGPHSPELAEAMRGEGM